MSFIWIITKSYKPEESCANDSYKTNTFKTLCFLTIWQWVRKIYPLVRSPHNITIKSYKNHYCIVFFWCLNWSQDLKTPCRSHQTALKAIYLWWYLNGFNVVNGNKRSHGGFMVLLKWLIMVVIFKRVLYVKCDGWERGSVASELNFLLKKL